MGMTYFKRYRMDIPIADAELTPLKLSEGFSLLSWRHDLLRDHATVKWQSFENEIDSTVFPCLGNKRGCLRLMGDIAKRGNFVPEATWLAVKQDHVIDTWHAVGTVQGLRDEHGDGAIQNLGIVPEFRGLGIGTALLKQALFGFQQIGCRNAHLEVTVHNTSAIKLYERMGFHRTETVFKVADVALV